MRILGLNISDRFEQKGRLPILVLSHIISVLLKLLKIR